MNKRPTEVELEILHVLWDRGPSTVREVHNVQTESKDVSYATTVKMLAIMFEKGLVDRDDSVRPQVYRAAVSEKRTQIGFLEDLVQRVYHGSSKSLVQHLLSSKRATEDELNEIRELIDQMDEKE